MEADYIPRREHEEFARRQDEENKRQNRRISELEETVRQIGALTTSVEKLAVSLESMVKEQEQQGKRLAELEKIPGRKWNRIAEKALDTVIGILVGGAATGILLLAAQYIH